MQTITPLAASALTGQRSHTDLFDREDEADIGHIRLLPAMRISSWSRRPRPISWRKMTGGHADDLASTALLATTLPILDRAGHERAHVAAPGDAAESQGPSG